MDWQFFLVDAVSMWDWFWNQVMQYGGLWILLGVLILGFYVALLCGSLVVHMEAGAVCHDIKPFNLRPGAWPRSVECICVYMFAILYVFFNINMYIVLQNVGVRGVGR